MPKNHSSYIVPLIVILLSGCIAEKESNNGACSQDHEQVGRTAELQSTGEHFAPTGMVTILDDCTITLSNFNWDAVGDETYVWAGFYDDLSSGFAISSPVNRDNEYVDEELSYMLPENRTLDDLDCIAIYETAVDEPFSWALFQ